MTLKVLIVDDEPLALDRLRMAFRAVPGVDIVGEARNGKDALAKVEALTPDIVILDIQMPSGNGLEVAQRLKNTPVEIVFATAFDHFAADAFEVEASDYLLKPIRIDRLQAAMDRARRRADARQAGLRISELELVVDALRRGERPSPGMRYEAELWVPRPGGVTRVPLDQVIWIEAARDYLLIHTANRTFALRETMSRLSARLDPAIMLRVHRSAFVHRSSIDSVERQGRDAISLTLSNNSIVRVGASYRSGLLACLGTNVPNRKQDLND